MKKSKGGFAAVFLIVGLILGGIIWWSGQSVARSQTVAFDGDRALKDVVYQVSLGPRVPGSQAHEKEVQWITGELKTAGWTVDIQNGTKMGHPIENIVAKRGSGKPWIVIGAHYDSRIKADQDPDPARRTEAVPGANDGASGVSVLLELARSIPANLQKQVWLVFFDAEDNGEIPGWDWLLGSELFVEQLQGKPDSAIVIDMIGDANLDIKKEPSSNPVLTQEIWDQAAELGDSGHFLSSDYAYTILDDHTPFLQASIRAIDVIDFNYAFWHTTQDTTDKVSAKSLKIVGDTLGTWLLNNPG